MTSEVLLAGSNLTKRFEGVMAVDDISLAIAPRELQCIIGPNGAGKSTLFNILGGVIRPDAGDIIFEGVSLSGLPLHGFARRGIARKFQIPSVFESLTVAQNLETAVLRPGLTAEHARRVTAMLNLIGQTSIRDQAAGSLAHGHKQWLEIGMALMSEPRLLLLDEPTAGMTPDETRETAALVRRLAQTTAVMAIEHDMSFVRALGCRTIVMHHGRAIAEGTFAEIEEDALVRDVYLGRA
ncbi:MAG: ATP-binding cassette domain-containing protein [Deltaproteobacteria bacterium]|nr:ATP-binding cassette domain-containing protein [Deltaproteobacteria bacterium]